MVYSPIFLLLFLDLGTIQTILNFPIASVIQGVQTERAYNHQAQITNRNSRNAAAMLATISFFNATKETDCLTCIKQKHKFCSNGESSTCCDITDQDSEGCNAESDKSLICSDQLVDSKSQKYEMCPHIKDQCLVSLIDPLDFLDQADTIQFNENQPSQIYLTDDGFWNEITINSKNSTVCSFNFLNPNTTQNMIEIKVENYTNTFLGLYYYSTSLQKFVDAGIFDPNHCASVKNCVKSDNGYIVFSLEDARDVTVNIIPIALSTNADSIISYRLINKQDRQQMKQTLSLMGIGFVLILGEMDPKSNMGLDWFSFQTQIRKLVMELIEPTVKRAYEDHESVQNLNYNYDKLKTKVEENDMKFSSQLMRSITVDEVSKRIQDIEKARNKEEEKLWNELGKQETATNVARDRLITVQQEAHTFTKLTENLTHEVKEMALALDDAKLQMIEQVIKSSEQQQMDVLEVKSKFMTVDEQLRLHKYYLDNHNDLFLKQQIWIQTLENGMHEYRMDTNENIERQILELRKEFDSKQQLLMDQMNESYRIDLIQTKNEIMKILGLGKEDTEVEDSQLNDGEKVKEDDNLFGPLFGMKYLHQKRSDSKRIHKDVLRKTHSDDSIMIKDQELQINERNIKSQQNPQQIGYKKNYKTSKSLKMLKEIEFDQMKQEIAINDHYRRRSLISSSPMPIQQALLHQRYQTLCPEVDNKNNKQENKFVNGLTSKKQKEVKAKLDQKKQLLSLDQIWSHVQDQFKANFKYAEDEKVQKLDEQLVALKSQIDIIHENLAQIKISKVKNMDEEKSNESALSNDFGQMDKVRNIEDKDKDHTKNKNFKTMSNMGVSQGSKLVNKNKVKLQANQTQDQESNDFQELKKSVQDIQNQLSNINKSQQDVSLTPSQFSTLKSKKIIPLKPFGAQESGLKLSLGNPPSSSKFNIPTPNNVDNSTLLQISEKQEEMILQMQILKNEMQRIAFQINDNAPLTANRGGGFDQTHQSFAMDQSSQHTQQIPNENIQSEIIAQMKKFEEQIAALNRNTLRNSQQMDQKCEDDLQRGISYQDVEKSQDFESHLDRKLTVFGEIHKKDVRENLSMLTNELNQKINELKYQLAESITKNAQQTNQKHNQQQQHQPKVSLAQGPQSFGLDGVQVDLRIFQAKQDILSQVQIEIESMRSEFMGELENNVLTRIEALSSESESQNKTNAEQFKYIEKYLQIFEENIDQITQKQERDHQAGQIQKEQLENIEEVLNGIEQQNLDDKLVNTIKAQKVLKDKIKKIEEELENHQNDIVDLQTQKPNQTTISQLGITETLNYIRDFELQLQKVQAQFEDKFITLNSLDLELQRGVKRNIRDKTDYMLQMQKQQETVDKQLLQQKDQISEICGDFDKFRNELLTFIRAYYEGRDLDSDKNEMMAHGNVNSQNESLGIQTSTQSSSKLQPVTLTDSSEKQFKIKSFLPQVNRGVQMVDQRIQSNSDFHDHKKQSQSQMAKKMPKLNNYSQMFDFVPQALNQSFNNNNHHHNRSVDMCTDNNNQNNYTQQQKGTGLTIGKYQINNISQLQLVTSNVNWENVKLKDTSRLQNYILSNKNMIISEENSPIGLRALVSTKGNSSVVGIKNAIQTHRIGGKRGSSLH